MDQAAEGRDARLIGEHGGSVRTTIRQSMLPVVKTGFLSALSPGAGEIFPQPTVSIHGTGSMLLDEATGPTTVIVVVGNPSAEELVRLDGAAALHDGRIVVVGAPGASAGRSNENERVLFVEEEVSIMEPWLRSLNSSSALVRPDHIVFGTDNGVDGAMRLISEYEDRIKKMRKS